MKRVIITPLDVIHFGSSRPFYKGENFIALQGDITPLPFAGAIRSKILSTKTNGEIPSNWYEIESHPDLKEVVEIVGTPTSAGKISFFGLYAYAVDPSKNELFLCPNDIVRYEDNRDSKLLLKPCKFDKFKINDDIYPVMSKPNGSFYVKEDKEFITRSGLERYLEEGDTSNANAFIPKSSVIFEERRVGIELDKDKKTTKEGMFYSINYIRLCEGHAFSLWINDSFNLPSRGILKIGSKGRYASYEVTDNNDKFTFSNIIKDINKARKFKLYLSTPAIFFGKNDNENICIPSTEKLNKKLGVTTKLISMIQGKPMRIGGWDMAKNRQKPLRYAVRSGAVYFYKIDDQRNIDEKIEMPVMISDTDSWLGLGSAFIGRW